MAPVRPMPIAPRAPARPAPTVKIGFPRDPVKAAHAKEAELARKLTAAAFAWKSYFGRLSLGYIDAHAHHVSVLSGIKEALVNQQRFVTQILFTAVLPTFVGGGMSALVADRGKAVIDAIRPVASRQRVALAEFGVNGASAVTSSVITEEMGRALKGLVPQPGSEWGAAGVSPAKFFVQLEVMIADYVTRANRDVQSAKDSRNLDHYVDTLNTHLLSPFVRNAPDNVDTMYSGEELKAFFIVFLWVVWAKSRKKEYWVTQITRANEPDGRSFVGVLIDAGLKDTHAVNRAKAQDAVRQLKPILESLLACGIRSEQVTQGIASSKTDRFLNILWVANLPPRRKGTVLERSFQIYEGSVSPIAFEERTITKFDRLL